ncbi:hypothetical protein ACIPPN_28695 [Streptomyces diastaticus]|uniref:Uncharacterized protein n=1 Tax=Streptomyces diastaticus subsp. diastaticus TaxID=68040 RepID=A0ABQ1CSS0_STRDI|nr:MULTISPECIES: hypothetical protein [Streptomyces]NEE60118.1 hypothetical protein [Streptomyces sp. SID8455]WTD01109.1 hypothetical protein OH717_00235 [Streptomyces albidoflavus]PKR41300.1 hypothetical protein CWE27_32055 [Streptomyces sp. EAG2]RPK88717.1 hypothetical protein EES47_13695 [Streptomyces sp. ADI98-12]GFH73254.1 hypothetical protein Sdia_40220 [Streptomyces diastaticus subsp. diastaticus]
MAEPGTELFEAIRRDHQAGDRLPRALAVRHGVPHQTVMEAISTVLPLPLDLPADEEELDQARQLLDALLEEDQAKAPAERCSAFELYEELSLRASRLLRHLTGTTRAGLGGQCPLRHAEAPSPT